jgi:hypothetical protein
MSHGPPVSSENEGDSCDGVVWNDMISVDFIGRIDDRGEACSILLA